MNRHQVVLLPWLRLRLFGNGLFPCPSLLDFPYDLLHLGIRLVEQVPLPHKGVLDLVGELQPFLPWARTEVSECADEILPANILSRLYAAVAAVVWVSGMGSAQPATGKD